MNAQFLINDFNKAIIFFFNYKEVINGSEYGTCFSICINIQQLCFRKNKFNFISQFGIKFFTSTCNFFNGIKFIFERKEKAIESRGSGNACNGIVFNKVIYIRAREAE